MIQEIIKNFIALNEIKKYSITQRYWSFLEGDSVLSLSTDVVQTIKLGNSIAFVHNFYAIGLIDNITDIASKPFFKLDVNTSIDSFVDYKKLASFKEFCGAIEVKSDFISIHQNRLSISYVLSNCILSTIYQAHLNYFLLTPLL
jgi:hypothetical protein